MFVFLFLLHGFFEKLINKLNNSFLANLPSLYPLKTPENSSWFFGVFKGSEMGKLTRNGLITFI